MQIPLRILSPNLWTFYLTVIQKKIKLICPSEGMVSPNLADYLSHRESHGIAEIEREMFQSVWAAIIE